MLSTPPPTTCVLLSICCSYNTHRISGAIRQLYSTTQYPSESASL
nr:MAG TPA: hypothetical protein [Bacteriophage sp.]